MKNSIVQLFGMNGMNDDYSNNYLDNLLDQTTH